MTLYKVNLMGKKQLVKLYEILLRLPWQLWRLQWRIAE